MENPMLDFEMELSEKLKKAFYEGYEAGIKDAEYYALHCGDTDEPQTNADRIRAMSDEELAKWLASVEVRILDEQPIIGLFQMRDNWLDFLKQECE